MDNFDIKAFDVEKFDSILARGLSFGLGRQGDQVCIEAAICETLGLAHGDDPKCVAIAVRRFKIRLNDSKWSSPTARAKGLRDLGIAQLGSLGVVNDSVFTSLMAKKLIQQLIPTLFREIFPNKRELLEVADRCEREGSMGACREADKLARAAAAAAAAANAAAAAADAKSMSRDKYLNLAAALALETLRELDSPGIKLL